MRNSVLHYFIYLSAIHSWNSQLAWLLASDVDLDIVVKSKYLSGVTRERLLDLLVLRDSGSFKMFDEMINVKNDK
jgi:hypothetical protein